jgi:hypothetical protein
MARRYGYRGGVLEPVYTLLLIAAFVALGGGAAALAYRLYRSGW